MFSLVVLAVYGLGGIFVPMLIIRWAGYQPDTRHSVTMMIAALVGVITWRLLGLNEHVFESIPGMSMAFLAHFVDHAYRIKEGSPLGRFEMPSGRAIGIAALVVLAPATAAEGAYLLRDAPAAADAAASWSIEGTLEYVEIGSGEEFVADGQTVPVDVHSDGAAGAVEVETLWASWQPWSTTKMRRRAGLGVRPLAPQMLPRTPSLASSSGLNCPKAPKARTQRGAPPPTR